MLKLCCKKLLFVATTALLVSASGVFAAGGWTSDGVIFDITGTGMPPFNPDTTLGMHSSDLGGGIFQIVQARNYVVTGSDITLDGGATIAVGKKVNIDYFYVETVNKNTPIQYSATLSTSKAILGTVTGGFVPPAVGVPPLSETFAATDTLINVPASITYEGNKNRWLESNDRLTVDYMANTINYDFRTVELQDAFRVFTLVPEPSTYMIMGGTLGLVLLLAARRKKQNA